MTHDPGRGPETAQATEAWTSRQCARCGRGFLCGADTSHEELESGVVETTLFGVSTSHTTTRIDRIADSVLVVRTMSDGRPQVQDPRGPRRSSAAGSSMG